MRILVNGEAREVPGGATVREFLESIGLSGVRLAVERNGAVLPKERHAEEVISEGDALEIVTFVGGG